MVWEVGKIVWAKLASYPYWPARVSDISNVPKSIKEVLAEDAGGEERELVWFFGSHNYSYVPRENVENWSESYEERVNNKKLRNQKGYVKAIEEANKALEEKGEPIPKASETSPPKSKKENHQQQVDEEEEEEEEQEEKTQQEPSTPKQDTEKEATKQKESAKKKRESEPESEKSKSKPQDETPKKRPATSNDAEKKEHKKSKPSEEVEKRVETPSGEKKKLSASAVSSSLKIMARHPVAKYFKYEITKYSEGSATAKAYIPSVRDNKEEVHSCLAAMHFLVDITAYAALASMLQEGDSGFTQNIHVACLSPNIPLGEEITIKATALPSKATHLLFASVEVIANNKQLLSATVTKTTAEYNFPIIHSRDSREQ